MPTDEDKQKLLKAMYYFWEVSNNPDVRFNPPAKRIFHRVSNAAMILGILARPFRLGELLSLKTDDYKAACFFIASPEAALVCLDAHILEVQPS